MNIKVEDKVVVIAGSDKGKEGKIIKTLRSENKVVVEGVNVVKKHQKPTANENGGIIEFPAPIHVSNVKKIEEKETKKATKKETTKKDKK